MTDRERLVELCKTACRRGRDCSKSCYECVADHLIENGVTIQKWIPVTERMPEGSGRYLCYVKSFAFPGRYYTAILQYDDYGFREGNIYTDDVTHWMPLPEPPKEEA